MKRHPILIPISREHHQMLLLAQLLKEDAPAYRDMPQTIEGKVAYAKELQNSLLDHHLSRDCQIIFPFLATFKGLRLTAEELLKRNSELSKYLYNLSELSTTAELDKIGKTLEKYVRTKERILFEKAQESLSEEDFVRLEKQMNV